MSSFFKSRFRNSRNSKENANAWLENNKEALPAHCSV
ncbi:hypothetical protein OIU79_024595 [Salix purpurea]|uniref:Uncharacterized protein n=1 Tax=Salix purpurea TaxID=77065 RepID=A0A9Q1AAM7_SALPP|nr:hypothetical protein OIU79_024595 [Salix purpurea]